MPRLYGERIVLRELKKEDIKEMRKWVEDAEVTNNLSDAFMFPNTNEETERFANDILDGKSPMKLFVIADKETDEYIGQLALPNIDWKNRTTELAIVIGGAEHRGKGYGTEAIKLVEEFVFHRINLNRIELCMHDYNNNAYKCYLKCGFIEEGRKRHCFYINGKYADKIIMGILKSDYEKTN